MNIADFPDDVEKLGNVPYVAGACLFFIVCHFLLWLISLVKIVWVKNPAYLRKDTRLELIIEKYDEHLKRREAKRRGSIRDSKTRLLDTDHFQPNENYQIQFMREVLYNYLDKELKQRRIDD